MYNRFSEYANTYNSINILLTNLSTIAYKNAKPRISTGLRLLRLAYAMAQQQSANAAAENDAALAEAERQGQANLAWETARAQAWASKQETANQVFLENIKSQLARGEKITEEQERRVTEMMKIEQKGQWDVRVQQSKPKPKAPSSGKK